MSDGAMPLPSALRPWHEEQPRKKIALPCETSVDVPLVIVDCALGSADATPNAVPNVNSAATTSTGTARRWRRKLEIRFNR